MEHITPDTSIVFFPSFVHYLERRCSTVDHSFELEQSTHWKRRGKIMSSDLEGQGYQRTLLEGSIWPNLNEETSLCISKSILYLWIKSLKLPQSQTDISHMLHVRISLSFLINSPIICLLYCFPIYFKMRQLEGLYLGNCKCLVWRTSVHVCCH